MITDRELCYDRLSSLFSLFFVTIHRTPHLQATNHLLKHMSQLRCYCSWLYVELLFHSNNISYDKRSIVQAN